MSTLYVDTINEKTSGNGIYIPGHVLQVQQTVFKDTFSTSIGSGFAEVTGLRCSITPKSTSSTILLRANGTSHRAKERQRPVWCVRTLSNLRRGRLSTAIM